MTVAKDLISRPTRRRTQLGEDEQAFLVSCAKVGAPLGQPPVHLDWDALLGRLISDGLGPLAFQRFKERPALLPAPIFAALKRNYYQNASANHIRLEELRRLGRLLALRGIPLLVLKGGALAATVYSDPALRFMGDLDIAAPPRHSSSALSLLQAEGYRLHGKISDLDDPALMHEKGWHLRLTRRVHGKDIEVEFHWPRREQVLVAQMVMLDTQSLWKHARTLDAENNLRQLAATDTLFHLCLHTGLQHRFTELGLRHYVDLDRVIRHSSSEPGFWPAFVNRARAANAKDVSYFSLLLSHHLLNTPIPAGVMADLNPPNWKSKLFARTVRSNDIINRTDVLYDRGSLWWRLLITDRLLAFVLGPLRLLFPGRLYLSSYYGTQSGWRLSTLTLWHPVHVLTNSLRKRYRRYQSQRVGSQSTSS